jgi:UDP-2-acetamido-2-deoxy-ribo-hexuluronate aminotransferase
MDFVDLAAQQRRISAELRRRIDTVLAHGQYIMGPEVAELEERLAKFTATSHCISCANGTDALHMALLALDIGPGDAVITSPMSFMATAEVIGLVGATPLFVDVDEDSYTLDPAALEALLADLESGRAPASGIGTGLRPRAIIPVDLYGLPADYRRINEVASRHGLTVIADAAQSFGARQDGVRVGGLASVTTTSFFPAKPLGCYGDGGALFTDDADLARILRSLRVHGRGVHKYHNVRPGLNSRLDTLQAAILLAKLDVFESELEIRQEVASHYTAMLADAVRIPQVPVDRRSAWAQYAVMIPDRDPVRIALERRGIPTAAYYPIPLHLQPVFGRLGYEPGSLPVSERLADEVLCIPMHPYLGEAERMRVADALGEAVTERAS